MSKSKSYTVYPVLGFISLDGKKILEIRTLFAATTRKRANALIRQCKKEGWFRELIIKQYVIEPLSVYS